MNERLLQRPGAYHERQGRDRYECVGFLVPIGSKNPLSPPVKIADAILDNKFTPVYSQGMIEEYEEVLGRDYLRLPKERVDAMLAHIKALGEAVSPADSGEDFSDPDDKIFFCTALAADAKVVTGNIRHYPQSAVVITPAEFCEILGI